MTKEFWEDILEELKNRETWEQNQDDWYRMRYEGIKRLAPPYPGAPDMHYPLIDSMMEKLKPFFIAQIYGQEQLAVFASGIPQNADITILAEKLFDYTTKQFTNFERAMHTAIDYMLLYGHGPVKIKYSKDKESGEKKIELVNIRPVYLIVPSHTEEVNKADWVVHVIHMSEAQYRANPEYVQTEAFISSITGKGENRGVDVWGTVMTREGITVGQSDKQIVLWEVYSKNAGKWRVDLISPMAGYDKPIRPPFYLPYKHNEVPICDLRYELGDVDFYGARGVGEILGQFELDLCKLWNHKLQWLDFAGNPNYTNTGMIANPANFKNKPGKILPQGVAPVQQPSAPLDFTTEMDLQRSLAEDRVQIPDLNAGSHLQPGKSQKGDVTATQIDALMSQNTSGNDMRARIFRLQLAPIMKQIWSLRCQYFTNDDELLLEDFTEVPAEALHDDYRLFPSGSADSYNKEFRAGKAMMNYQIFKGNPAIKQDELSKYVLETEDPALVKRLYQAPADAQQSEAQRQASEILLMQEGFPPAVLPTDSDPTHIMTIAQWAERKQVTQEPVASETAKLALQHGQQHVQSMQQKHDKQGMAVMQDPTVQQAMQFLNMIANSGQQPGQPPGVSGASAPAGMPPGPQGPGAGAPPGGAGSQDKPSAIANALAALIKAGVQMAPEDVNAALAKMDLPPLATGIKPPAPTLPPGFKPPGMKPAGPPTGPTAPKQ